MSESSSVVRRSPSFRLTMSPELLHVSSETGDDIPGAIRARPSICKACTFSPLLPCRTITGTSGTPSPSKSSEPSAGPTKKRVIANKRVPADLAAICLMNKCPQYIALQVTCKLSDHRTRELTIHSNNPSNTIVEVKSGRKHIVWLNKRTL